MPLNRYYGGNGEKVMRAMKHEYGSKKGESVFYATANKRGQRPPDSTPGTGGGGYERTPDQSDREQARYRAAQAMGRARAERRATRKTKPRPIRPAYGRAWDDYPTNA